MRLFAAIPAPEAWRAAAERARMDLERALQPPAGDALRWVQPALLHVTVSFFAEVEDHQLEPLQTALDEAAAGIHLALSLGPAGTFGGRSRVRALWLAVEAPGLEAQIARNDRFEDPVEAIGVRASTPRQFEDVAKSTGGDQPAQAALALKHRIGGDGGAVDDGA